MMVLKELYRRGSNFLSAQSEVVVTAGKTYTWTFENPGWIAFDFMANVPPKNGELGKKYLKVNVGNALRFKAMGGWAWQRYYIFVDAGVHTVKFFTEGYEAGDSAKIRYINLTDFPKVPEYEMIENTAMPKPLEKITSYDVVQGWQRYQRTGSQGCELSFTLIFTSVDNWQQFMSTLENFYIIKGDYGVYGGTILPQEVESTRTGALIFADCVLRSPMRAGVGVNGI